MSRLVRYFLHLLDVASGDGPWHPSVCEVRF